MRETWQDCTVRIEVDELLGEVFGEGNMGYQPEEDADGDPFSSNSEDSDPSEDEESFTAQFQMMILVLYVYLTMSFFLTDVLTTLAIDI